VNCWKPLIDMNATAQSVMIIANAKKGMDWAISSQTTKKLAEGSTTRQSNLKSNQITVKCPRVQETRSPLLNINSIIGGEDMDKVWIVYKTTNLINGCTYFGVHGTTNLNDRYIGSGKILRLAVRKYGRKNFERIILASFDNAKDAYDHEASLVTSDLVNQPDVYNVTTGGTGRRELTEEGLSSIIMSRRNKVVAFDKELGKKVSITKAEFIANPARFVGNTKGYRVMKTLDNTVVVVGVDDTSNLVGVTRGQRKALTNDGKTVMVSVDDPRFLTGELRSVNKGKVIVKDTNGNKFAVDQSDPRLTSGELVGVASGKRYKHNKKRPQVTCPHCSKLGDASNMQRWHFDRCKNRVKI